MAMFPHDQLFKELLRLFFRGFLELFFPNVAIQIDFSSIRFLEQEVFTDFSNGDPHKYLTFPYYSSDINW